MKLIVGLGNPGSKYLLTRHNIGFIVIDALASMYGASFSPEHKSQLAKIRIGSEVVLIVKPQTYMNDSGIATQSIMAYYKVEAEDLLVLHDEVDQIFGEIKYQKNRGHGGHNGIRDIHNKISTKDYTRLRIGVGRPNGKMDVASFVLQNFTNQEQSDLPTIIDECARSVENFCKEGFELTANKFNQKILDL